MTDILTPYSDSQPKFTDTDDSMISSPSHNPKVAFGVDPQTGIQSDINSQELSILNSLKKEPIAQDFPDRFLVICLVTRKWDQKRTVQLLENNLKMRKKFGYLQWNTLPKLNQLNASLISNFGVWKIPGLTTHEGHAVHFLQPAKLIPKNYQFKDIVDYAIWTWHIGSQTASIEDHRKGFVIIEDLSGISFSNIDYKVSSELMGSIQDKIPTKMKKILMINPPSFLSALMSFAKLFLSKKMLSRFELLKNPKDLSKYVDMDQMPVAFGGKVHYNSDDYCQDLKQFATQHNL